MGVHKGLAGLIRVCEAPAGIALVIESAGSPKTLRPSAGIA